MERHVVQHVPGRTPWINVKITGNELVDWTDVDAAEQLFADILDPNTGEPVLVRGDDGAGDAGLSPRGPSRRSTRRRSTFAPDGAPTATSPANPLGNYRVFDSRLAYRRIVAAGVGRGDAKKWWFLGDFKQAFAYMENWPITVTQAPLGSEADFNNDIVLRFKASERGAAAVLNPRYVVKSTG